MEFLIEELQTTARLYMRDDVITPLRKEGVELEFEDYAASCAQAGLWLLVTSTKTLAFWEGLQAAGLTQKFIARVREIRASGILAKSQDPHAPVRTIGAYDIRRSNTDPREFYITSEKFDIMPRFPSLDAAIRRATEWNNQDELAKAAERKFGCRVHIDGDHGSVRIRRYNDNHVLMRVTKANGTYDETILKALSQLEQGN